MNNESVNNEKKEIKQKPLNIRQQKFCDEILKGKTQREAYLVAGYKFSDDNTMDHAASQLVSNRKLSLYLSKKRGEVEKRVDISREKMLRMLSEIAQDAKTDNKYRDSTAAIAEINKMQGYNAPVKVETKTQETVFDPAKLPLDVVVELSRLIKKIESLRTVGEEHSEQAGIEKIKIDQ
jgi:phage terminase small subunit